MRGIHANNSEAIIYFSLSNLNLKTDKSVESIFTLKRLPTPFPNACIKGKPMINRSSSVLSCYCLKWSSMVAKASFKLELSFDRSYAKVRNVYFLWHDFQWKVASKECRIVWVTPFSTQERRRSQVHRRCARLLMFATTSSASRASVVRMRTHFVITRQSVQNNVCEQSGCDT